MRRVLRWLGLAVAVPAVGFCIVMARFLLPEAPPLRAAAAPDTTQTVTETGVRWVPGIGPRTYGACTRILSIDGGGVRGLMPALVLEEIERRTGVPVFRSFDLIAGTSTGSILALGLTRPSDQDARAAAFSAADLVRFYEEHAAEIFPRMPAPFRGLRRIFRPAYDVGALEALYERYFSDVRLLEALTNVLVPVYEIEEGRRVWFSNVSGYTDALMREIVRGATAAPTYLPPARISVSPRRLSKGYVAAADGALFANNPAEVAVGRGASMRTGTDKSILLLSLGTGASRRATKFEDTWSWGILGWMDPLLEIAYSDPSIDYALRQALGPNTYVRIQPDLGSPPVALDDSGAAALQRMREATQREISAHADDLEHLVTMLSLPRSPDCGLKVSADYERPEGPRRPLGKAGAQR